MKYFHSPGLTAMGMMLFVVFAAMRFPGYTDSNKQEISTSDGKSVADVLKELGKAMPGHVLKTNMDGASAQKGKELVEKGFTTDAKGKRTKKQSKFYQCTACHNTVKEFENPADWSPDKRLEYAVKNKIPYLQATSFYGIVNRTSYYNDDYQKKYKGVSGITEANKDLRAAIQFCSQTCSQGRKLADWEIESILAYFWELQLKMEDLKLEAAEKKAVDEALAGSGDKSKAIELLESKYVRAFPAHFAEVPHYEEPSAEMISDKKRQEIGEAIFDNACLHCHYKERYSFYGLEKTSLNFKHLESATRTHNHIYSMYLLVRDGLPPRIGRKAYMPQFTKEKMSEEQLLNLYIYVLANAKK